MATMIKAVVKEDTLWACIVNDITDTHLELQVQVIGNEVPRVSAEKVRQTHWTFARIFPPEVVDMGMVEMMVSSAEVSCSTRRSARIVKAARCLLGSLIDIVCATVAYGKNGGDPWSSSGAVDLPDRMCNTRRRQRSHSFTMGVVQGIRKAKRLRTEAQLLSAKEVLRPDEFQSSDKSLSRSNSEFANTERWNYIAAPLQSHRCCQTLPMTCDATEVGPVEYLAVGISKVDAMIASFGPPRESIYHKC